MRRESLSALQRFGSILRGPVCASYIFGAFRERYCSSMPRPGERVFDCHSEASWCARQPCAMRNTEDCRVRRRSLRRGGFLLCFLVPPCLGQASEFYVCVSVAPKCLLASVAHTCSLTAGVRTNGTYNRKTECFPYVFHNIGLADVCLPHLCRVIRTCPPPT